MKILEHSIEYSSIQVWSINQKMLLIQSDKKQNCQVDICLRKKEQTFHILLSWELAMRHTILNLHLYSYTINTLINTVCQTDSTNTLSPKFELNQIKTISWRINQICAPAVIKKENEIEWHFYWHYICNMRITYSWQYLHAPVLWVFWLECKFLIIIPF